MADAQANINVNLDATRALAQLKNLQRQIATFNAEIARGGAQAAAGAARMQQNMVSGINATGQFSATMVRTRTTTESFTNSLEKNKFSMRQYFRNAGGATKKFGHLFSKEMGVIDKVARERVKTLQTQYVTMGRDASGAMKSIAVRPLALDMKNVATQTAIAAQKQQIFNGLLRQGSTNLLNWGKNTQWAGRQLMVGFTIPLAIFGAAASSSFMKLEEQAIKFKRVYGDLFTTPQQADEAFDDMAKLGAEFTKFGVSVEETLGLAAKAAQMGNMGADLTAQVTEATRLSVLGGMGQEEALDTTVSLTNAFGVATEDLTEKINFLNAAENQTILSIQDFNIAVPKAGSVVAQLGGDVEDLAFFLTAMREGGVNASQGANALKSSLGRLINPTQRAKDALSAYGIDVVGIVEENQGNLRETVLQLGGALDELDPLEKARAIETLFGKFQFARMSALFQNIMDDGSQAATVLELINSESGELSQLAGRELGRVEESAATKFKSAVEQFQVALAPIGESFIKLITPVIEFGTKILNAFNNMSDGAKSFVVGLIGILGGIGPILLMTIGLVANGIANLFGGFLNLREGMMRLKGESTTLGQQTQYMTQEQLEAASVASSLSQTHNSLTQTFTSEKAAVDNLVASYSRMIGVQQGALGTASMKAASGGATKAKGFRYGKKVPGYQEGIVMVPGRKGEGDTQPAMLAPGEAVIPAKMAEKYGPLINGMIEGSIPGYVKGRAVASHVSGFDPGQLAATIKMLSEAGFEFSAVVDRMTVNADGMSYTIDRVEGNLSSLVSEMDNVVLGGSTFAGTTIPESAERNAMYKDAGLAGPARNMDELFQQEQQLIAAMQQDETLYLRHGAEIDKLIAESREAQVVLASSNDQGRTKLAFEKERAKQAITFAQVTKQGLSQEQAEQLAGEQVEQAETIYAAAIREGHSKEQALNKARSNLLASMLRSGADKDGNLQVVAANRSIGTDAPRARAAGKGFATSDKVRRAHVRAGRPGPFIQHGEGFGEGARRSPQKGRLTAQKAQDKGLINLEAEEKRVIVAARQSVSKLAKNTVAAMENQLKTDLQSASPSQVMRNEMGNAVDGAIMGVQEGQDDMRVAGERLADATESGVRSGTGTGKTGRRVTVPGPITPTAAVGEVAAKTKNFGRSMEKATIKVAGMGAKIGMAGIGVSSLVGGLSMVEGPLGEFASKLFPLTSLVTGLSFAFQMLNVETIKAVGHRISESIASGRKAKTDLLAAGASSRAAVASNAAAAADTKQAVASAAATKGLASMTATSMLLGGGRIGTVVGNAVGKITKSANVFVGSVGRAANGLVGVLGRVGGALGGVLSRVAGAVVGFGGFIASLLGPVGLVVAGLALLSGGIFLLMKVINDQKAKVEGLGDAANISAEKLGNLSEKLGIEASGARASVIESAADASLAGETSETKSEILEVKKEFSNLLESDKEFRKQFKGTIAALKDGSQEAAQASMEMLAVSLQTEGYTEEQIQGVVSALLDEAERTDIELDFGSIDIKTQTGAVDAAAKEFVDSIEPIMQRAFGAPEAVMTGIRFDQASLDLFAETAASAIINLNAQFDQGIITLEEYEVQLENIRQKVSEIRSAGGEEAGSDVTEEIIKSLDPEDKLGLLGEKGSFRGGRGSDGVVDPLLDAETTRGDQAALSVAEATVAGVNIEKDFGPDAMGVLATGASKDATLAEAEAFLELKEAIEAATLAKKEDDAADEKITETETAVGVKTDEIDNQTKAIEEQVQAYDDAKEVLEGYADITDKEAMARKIANDEELRGLFLDAQAVDLAEGNTEQTDALIGSLNSQAEAQADLNAQQAEQQVKDEISDAKEKENALAGLTKATGDAALAQGILNNSMAYNLVAAKLMEKGVDIASASATQIATAIEESGVLALIDALVEVGGIEVPDLSGGTGTGGGGAKEDPTSFLDDIVKKYRDFGDSSQELTKGFDASLEAIMGFAKGGSWGLNGLSRQLRNVNISENLIEKFLGMEPEEWEKTKGKLFKFEDGQISGLTEQGEAVQQADASATIAEETDSLDSQTKSAEDQLAAFQKLRNQGASVALAYEMIQNKNIASAVATSKNTAEVKGLIKAQKELKELEAEIEEIDEEEQRKERIREAIKNMNKEFDDQVKALNKVRKATDKYSDAQIEAIFGNKDLRSLFLEPNIDKSALQKALDNAEKQAQLELDIKLLTFEGREDFLNEAFKKAKDKLSNEETKIELEFDAEVKGQEEVIRNAQNEIDSLTFMIDDYQAALDEVQFREDEINEKYDKRFEALDKIATINDRIAQQQKNQLSLAEALSKGDIAAAAQAAQTMREQEMQDNTESQREMMEMRQKAEVESIKSLGGMTRDQLEDQIDSLNRKVSSIEEQRLEPAEEYIRLAEIRRDREIENLEVLGRTSTQWDEIQNALDVARTRNFKFMNEMQEQFNQYPEILAKYLEGEPLPAPPALPKPPPPPPPKKSSSKKYKWEGEMAGPKGREDRARSRREVANRKAVRAGKPPPHPKTRTAGVHYATGGYVARMALGGAVRGGMFTNMAVGGTVPYRGKGGSSTRMATGGNVKGYPMGGLIPYKNAGGMFKSLGSDTIPAMLTPGEFVVRRPAVSGFGIENLEKINRGTYNDGSMYNYNLSINVKSDSNPEQIANTVMREIKRVDSQRIRNNRY